MTILTAIQEAAVLVSLPEPSQIIGSTQETDRLLLSLARREVKELARRADWSKLTREHTFTTTASELQSSALPSNFDRILSETFWNRTTDWQVFGPLSPQEWQAYKAESLSASVRLMWQRRHDGIYLYPEPPAGEVCYYEYIINTPILAVDGTTYRTDIAADADSFLLEEELLTLGVIWRFRKQKGLSYAEELKDYEMRVQAAISADRGARTLTLTPMSARVNRDIVPEGDWNQ